MKKTIAVVILTVWPIVVTAAFEALSRVTSSYYTYSTFFAIAALGHIPIFAAWVSKAFAEGTRWPIVFIFVVVQFFVLPTILKMLLAA